MDAMKIDTVADFNKALQVGPHVFPGGYPTYFITRNSEALSFEAAGDVDNAQLIREAIEHEGDPAWRVVRFAINWESELYCTHTGKPIDSAYDIA